MKTSTRAKSAASLVALGSLAALGSLVALALGGCSAEWSLPLAALDRVPLSVTQPGPATVIAVGGALGSTGDGLFMTYDGADWHLVSTGTTATLWWVHAATLSTAWAVGERGTVFKWNGSALAPVATPATQTLFGTWGLGDDDLWIVGGTPDLSGVILHRDAAGWHDLTPAGTSAAFFKVWGASTSDVFICGQNAAMLHWDGHALTAQAPPVPATTTLFTVAGSSGHDVYAVGGLDTAVAVHYDGAKWSNVADHALANAQGLTGVSVDTDGSVVFVGGQGAKFRGKPGALVDDSSFVTHEDLHGASLRDGEIFAVGGNYNAPAGVTRDGVVAHYGGVVASTVK
jgi:trimeric autotransporter adhesin